MLTYSYTENETIQSYEIPERWRKEPDQLKGDDSSYPHFKQKKR